MNKRYIKAILIGAAIGVCALACEAARQPDRQLFPGLCDPLVFIPFWDDGQTKETMSIRPDLQLTAVFLRFCMFFFEYGYYFLLVPICLSCLMVKLSESQDEFSFAVSCRRAIKLTGLILLCYWALLILPGVFCESTPVERVLSPIVGLWEGLKASIFFGVAEIIFVLSLGWHLLWADFSKRKTVKGEK